MRTYRHRAAGLFAIVVAIAPAVAARAGEIVVQPTQIVEMKAVFGQVQTRDVVPARARIGGTLASLEVTEGSSVKQGDVIATIVDDKIALRREAAQARVKAIETESANARVDLERAQSLLARGAGTQQRVDQLRTQVDVLAAQMGAAIAERAVIEQQATEGQVLSPATGRVLRAPATRGAVVTPGEAVATIAGGGFFVRIALPERHAPLLREDAPVTVVGRIGAEGGEAKEGRFAKLYPEIEKGRVIADVEVKGLGDYFVGERVLVRVPVAKRSVLAVPPEAVETRSGVDFVRLAGAQGARDVAVVTGGLVETAQGPRMEILTGLRPGDKVVTP